ncbi:MAG: hypothetical protein QW265_03465 [Candidatus Bathyarchaeia archaeon]
MGYKGSKPRIAITGSHEKAYVYGALGFNGRQYSNLKAKSFTLLMD